MLKRDTSRRKALFTLHTSDYVETPPIFTLYGRPEHSGRSLDEIIASML